MKFNSIFLLLLKPLDTYSHSYKINGEYEIIAGGMFDDALVLKVTYELFPERHTFGQYMTLAVDEKDGEFANGSERKRPYLK